MDVLDSMVEKALTLASHVSSSLCTEGLEELSIVYLEVVLLISTMFFPFASGWLMHG